jgi:hypothetical protein
MINRRHFLLFCVVAAATPCTDAAAQITVPFTLLRYTWLRSAPHPVPTARSAAEIAPSGFLWGADEIGRAIGRNGRQAFNGGVA